MILQELKKIFRIQRILLITAFAVLYYFLFFRLDIVPEYSSDRFFLELSLELMGKYGEKVDEAEYRDLLDNHVSVDESEINTWIKEHDGFKWFNIESYGDLIARLEPLSYSAKASSADQISEKFTSEEQQELWDIVFKGVLREIYMNDIIEAYDAELRSNQPTAYYSEIPEKDKKRIAERNQEEVFSVMPYSAMRKYLSFFSDFTIFLFLSMIFLIVPYSVKDTMEGIPVLQYSSQKGCRYYWKKLAAVFVGSFILCLMETGWFALMLSKNYAFSFAGCFVSGFGNPFITLMKLTFGQYIVMSLVYSACIALCLAMITYCLSGCARNYISAIAFQIPAIIFSFVVSFGFMRNFAEISQSVILLCMIPCICILAAVTGNVARFCSVKYYGKF